MKRLAKSFLTIVFLLYSGMSYAQQLLYNATFYQYISTELPQACTFSMFPDHVLVGDLNIGLASWNGTFYDYQGQGIRILWSPYVQGCVTLFANQTAAVYMTPEVAAAVPNYNYSVPNYGGGYYAPNYGGGYYVPNYGGGYNSAQRCLACHGTGRVERHIYSPGGGFYFCHECGRRRPNGHYHTNCSGCYGTGWIR